MFDPVGTALNSFLTREGSSFGIHGITLASPTSDADDRSTIVQSTRRRTSCYIEI